jgi:hypothetical protein
MVRDRCRIHCFILGRKQIPNSLHFMAAGEKGDGARCLHRSLATIKDSWRGIVARTRIEGRGSNADAE